MTYTPAAWYWNVAGGIYSSANTAVITTSSGALWTAYQAWLAAGNAATPMDTWANLDAVLAANNLPPSGQSLVALKIALGAAVAAASANLLVQMFGPDPIREVHRTAALNAAAEVTAAGGVPSDTAFTAYAAAWGYGGTGQPTLTQFAALVIVLRDEIKMLSAAALALQTSTTAATTGAQLATALAAFEAAIGGVVTAVNAATPPLPLVAPTAIVIRGINA